MLIAVARENKLFEKLEVRGALIPFEVQHLAKAVTISAKEAVLERSLALTLFTLYPKLGFPSLK